MGRITERPSKTRCILMYKILNGVQPKYLRNQFVYRSDVAQTCLKLKDTINKLALPLPKTDYLKKSLRYNGAKLWNSLKPELRQAQSLSKFKSLLKVTDVSRVNHPLPQSRPVLKFGRIVSHHKITSSPASSMLTKNDTSLNAKGIF